ncbi:MAG TPA: glycosyltransferase [Bryobacteraceae bacterium]
MLLITIATIPVLIWLYLLTGRAAFWRVEKNLLPKGLPKSSSKSVAVVIPARNEAAVVGDTLASLLAQNFPAPLWLVVVDDASEDGTADAVRTAGNVILIRGEPLPPGWTGKLWALSQGVTKALEFSPDYLLFTDADIHHSSENVAELVNIAEAQHLDLASYMVTLHCRTLPEKALIPAFVYFFMQLYPPAWIAARRHRTAGAAGGCVLIRPAALNRIGGFAAIRNKIIDDCALAQAVKHSGGRIWMGLTPATHSVRGYGGFSGIGGMIARTAFSQLHHSALLLMATLLGLFFVYLLPVALLFSGEKAPAILGAAAWLLMSVSYAPTLRFYRRSLLWSMALPPIALFYLSATVRSALQYWRGQGGEWKGRAQDKDGS